MANDPRPQPEKFGTLLGLAPGGVPAYSSDYASAEERELPTRHSYRSYLDGVYMGYKWQCVEFARRWLYVNKGWIFDDVAMAYDIFRLRAAHVARGQGTLPLRAFGNGSKRWPEPGCLLVWNAGGEFEYTGHVAIVVEVSESFVRCAEQNVGHQRWPRDCNWAREIRAQVTEHGEYWLECSFGDAEILGWVIQTDDDTHAEQQVEVDRRLFDLEVREIEARPGLDRSWLNVANADEAAYVARNQGHKLASREADQNRYYVISESAHRELVSATNRLHALFLHATDFVLRDDRLLELFALPRALWPKIHQSWDNRRNQLITGRLDFSVSQRGVKVYEYNCDSAACHMECGTVQGRWAHHFGCEDGRDPGAELHRELCDAWQESGVDGLVHIMQDVDPDETYHALFMKGVLEEAGFPCKILTGLEGLTWAGDGGVLDPEGEPIRQVWKTWAWETALDQLRAECEEDAASPVHELPAVRRDRPPRLVDVLLRPEVMVYEPLWTLLPSNKAILPVLSQLYPNHPYLLETSFELGPGLRERGYVTKPIVGRSGANIRIFDSGERLVAESSGSFEKRALVYQERFPLPEVGGYNAQVSTFTAAGRWAGSCLRVDPSLIITDESDNLPLRVVPDRDLERP